jgi:hypothetical protein
MRLTRRAKDETFQPPDEIKNAVMAWWAAGAHSAVKLKYRNALNDGPNSDYVVLHNWTFEPATDRHLAVSVFCDTGGYIGFGIEDRGRIAARLGVSNSRLWRGNQVVAAGREPGQTSIASLLSLLTEARDGRVQIGARTTPLGLGRTTVVATPQLTSAFPRQTWLEDPRSLTKSNFLARWHILNFAPWN